MSGTIILVILFLGTNGEEVGVQRTDMSKYPEEMCQTAAAHYSKSYDAGVQLAYCEVRK